MRLEALDYTSPAQWRWRLTDLRGQFVADHSVDFDAAAWEFEAFTDLYNFLRRNTTPDRRNEHEQQLIGQVGNWITDQLLGRGVAAALARERKTVRLSVPPEAAGLRYRPWELARVNGRTLAAHRVNFVVEQERHESLT